jgi:murein DD-endopeptidase MepM/ murein hydrolase activator NlpD
LFLRSDNETRFVRLRPTTQLAGILAFCGIVAWAVFATAILIMDSIGSGNFRAQAERDQRTYETRLNAMAEERDSHAASALAAQERFNTALEQISAMQSELLASEDRRRELEKGIDVIQRTLRGAVAERDEARAEVAGIKASLEGEAGTSRPAEARAAEVEATLEKLTEALTKAADDRDRISSDSAEALAMADDIILEMELLEEQNERIFRQLEEAMTVSVAPLEQMFENAGMDTDRMIRQVQRGYNGEGGPLESISLSTMGVGPSSNVERANRLLNQMDQLNLYRMAAEGAPFANPVKSAYRFTSGFGYRRDPKTGGRRMHNGTDFAAPHGTDIFATADGVVTFAGWNSGYGNYVEIQHEFGIETRYGHMSRIRVKKGQRVSRGQQIGDMGSTGRSTGTHLHYEVRVNGKPVNPMNYIEAAYNVF